MTIYRRDTKLRLWLLRILGGLAVFSVAVLISSSHSDYGWVLLFLVSCGAIFPLTELEIGKGVLYVCQFYAYGFIPRRWEFQSTDKGKLQPFDLVISDSSPAYTDDWYDAFLFFAPTTEIKVRKFVLKYVKATGDDGQIKLKLFSNEIDLLKSNLSVEQHCP
jgi:hypothetical protein